MLDDFIRTGEAYFDQQRGTLSLSHPTTPLDLSQLSFYRQHVRSLSLNHCQLHSLQGIEQFLCLEQLSIRYNHIESVSQIYRITNKDKIQQLDFTGNDIEYLGGGLFLNLVRDFPKLIELNGRNYYHILNKGNSKNNCMKKIVARSHRIQKDLMRIATKEQIKSRPSQTEPYQISMPTERRQKITTKGYQEQQQSQSSSSLQSDAKNTSKKRSFLADQQNIDLRENPDYVNRNTIQNDVSLGAISSIPMTKSVSGSCAIDRQPKRKGLQIFTLNQSMQGQRIQIAQPTATFAMQREKENNLEPSSSFVFKNREKIQKYRNSNTPIEQDEDYKQSRFTKRDNYGQFEGESQGDVSWGSELEDSLMREERLTNKYTRGVYADAYFAKVALIRAFTGWKCLRGQKNLPMRRR